MGPIFQFDDSLHQSVTDAKFGGNGTETQMFSGAKMTNLMHLLFREFGRAVLLAALIAMGMFLGCEK